MADENKSNQNELFAKGAEELMRINEMLEAEIEQRKQVEARLAHISKSERSKQQQLAAETRSKSQFINVLSHELRTPLTPLIASAGLLEETFRQRTDSHEYRLASLLLKGAHDLSRRLSDLLDMARLMNGEISLNIAEVDIRPLILKIYSQSVVSAAARDQSLKLDLPESLPHIEADRARMEQMLVNLISNAMNFNSIGKAVILRAKSKKDSIVIEVEDHGQALSPAEIDAVFLPYHHVQQDQSRFGGLGLGLAISKHIVEAQHGIMSFRSSSGGGNIFSVSLPIYQAGSRS